MKASLYHYKTLRDSPSEAELTSHKLMIKANMIKPIASGIYTWLPLGTLILKKVENIIHYSQIVYLWQQIQEKYPHQEFLRIFQAIYINFLNL